MAMDLQDFYFINAMNARNAIHTRAKSIQDMYGITPTDIEEYRNQNGGFGFGRAIAIGAACIAVAAAIGLFTTMMPALFIGCAVASIAGTISMAAQNENIMHNYESYLDNVATEARLSQGRGQSAEPSINDNTPNRDRSYAADVLASRQPGMAQRSRA